MKYVDVVIIQIIMQIPSVDKFFQHRLQATFCHDKILICTLSRKDNSRKILGHYKKGNLKLNFLFHPLWLRLFQWLSHSPRFLLHIKINQMKSRSRMKLIPEWKKFRWHLSFIPEWNKQNFILGLNSIWIKSSHWG